MIKANELRVGNLVKQNKKNLIIDLIFMVNEIYNQDVYIVKSETHQAGTFEYSELEPIALTPEILEKCGFKKDGFGAYNIEVKNTFQTSKGILCFSGDYLYLRHENDNNKSNDSICTLWNKDLMKEFYLHDLQNIYHTLTGEELNITL